MFSFCYIYLIRLFYPLFLGTFVKKSNGVIMYLNTRGVISTGCAVAGVVSEVGITIEIVKILNWLGV